MKNAAAGRGGLEVIDSPVTCEAGTILSPAPVNWHRLEFCQGQFDTV